MRIRLLNIIKHKEYTKRFKALYRSAFPESERAPFDMLLSKAEKPNVNLFACLDGDEWIGFIYIVNHRQLSYLFYFAIDDKKRGQGYGTAVLRAVLKKYSGRRLFLAAEALDDTADNIAQRISRQRFYERAGFKRLGIQIQEGRVVFDALGTGAPVTNREYRALMKSYSRSLPYLLPMKVLSQ